MKFTFEEKIKLIKYQLKYRIILTKGQKIGIVDAWRNPISDEEYEKFLRDLAEDYGNCDLANEYVMKHAHEVSMDKKDYKFLKNRKNLGLKRYNEYRALFTKYFGDRFAEKTHTLVVWK